MHNQKLRQIEQPGSRSQRVTDYQYLNDDSTLVTKIIQPSVVPDLNRTTEISYSKQQKITQIHTAGYRPDGKAIERTVKMRYNNLGQLLSVDGARDDIKDLTQIDYYDCKELSKCGQIKRVRNALGQAVDYLSYDALGRVTKTRDANGITTNLSYHPRGWLLSRQQVASNGERKTTTTRYDQAGQVVEQEFADGARIQLRYDAVHALRSVQDALGNRIEYDYDANGNRIETALLNPQGETETASTTFFDLRNRVSAIKQGDSLTQTLTDAIGQLRNVTDPNANPATVFDYDDLGRLNSTLDALSQRTNYAYDVADRVIGVQSPNGAVTRFTFDDLGNQLLETSPDRGIVEYRHDAAGNVIASTDARNIETRYQYDALNRLVAVNYPEKGEDQRFEFDDCFVGALCAAKSGSVKTQYRYTAWGNISQQTDTVNGQTSTTEYQYDIAGRTTEIRYPDGSKITYNRDALGRVTAVSRNKQTVLDNREYRADGQFTKQRFANGVTEQRRFDNQGRLTQQQITGQTPETIDYAYDANGNVTSMDGLMSRAQGGAGATKQHYQYDSLNRITLKTNIHLTAIGNLK